MQKREIIKQYTNGELTIVWQPAKCIHAGVCASMLPEVYNPKERPWIKMENANTRELIEQISECPSGALSYFMNDAGEPKKENAEIKAEVLENGPLIIYGKLKITGADGKFEIREPTTAFCRCGFSGNKPYCDGAHVKADFKG